MHGWRTIILSGDRPDVVRRIATQVGIASEDAHGGATPEDKAAFIERLERDGEVVMVGDGVNDAGALARATVGVAVHGGAEASLAAADVFLGEPGLSPLRGLIAGARSTFSVIRLTLAFSLLYNVVCASIAIAGLMSPLLAGVLMPASSITVVLLARYLRSY